MLQVFYVGYEEVIIYKLCMVVDSCVQCFLVCLVVFIQAIFNREDWVVVDLLFLVVYYFRIGQFIVGGLMEVVDFFIGIVEFRSGGVYCNVDFFVWFVVCFFDCSQDCFNCFLIGFDIWCKVIFVINVGGVVFVFEYIFEVVEDFYVYV